MVAAPSVRALRMVLRRGLFMALNNGCDTLSLLNRPADGLRGFLRQRTSREPDLVEPQQRLDCRLPEFLLPRHGNDFSEFHSLLFVEEVI
jgi:hypothetical protein